MIDFFNTYQRSHIYTRAIAFSVFLPTAKILIDDRHIRKSLR
ncbi:hypothetical protein [Chamaesiphon minutus]|nr:hypothetical protein [Chamaesiphon minutus]